MDPLVSVVVEGYNEVRELGQCDNTIRALMAQDFPLSQIELILVGSPAQVDHWGETYGGETPFHSVKLVPFDAALYYELKNRGIAAATGKIVALTDSDVLPSRSWISAIVENICVDGADVSLGPTLFGREDVHDPESLWMRIVSSITWGWVLGKKLANGRPEARGFMDHNVAMKREVAARFCYNTDYGRIIASPLLFRALKDAGKIIAVHPRQQAVHAFWLRYWLISLQFRYGHEVYHLRRLDRKYPMGWMASFGPFEPIVTQLWHMALDVPKWFRMNRALQKSRVTTVLCLPALLAVSLVARTLEMLGMYSAMICPERTKKWAESV